MSEFEEEVLYHGGQINSDTILTFDDDVMFLDRDHNVLLDLIGDPSFGLDKDKFVDDLLRIDSDLDMDFMRVVTRNLDILSEHAQNSQVRFFVPFEVRQLLRRKTSNWDDMGAQFRVVEQTTIRFLEALVDRDVRYLVFPYIVDLRFSCLFVFEKKKKRSYHMLQRGAFHVFSWGESTVADEICSMIEEQGFNVQTEYHELIKVKKENQLLFLLELTESLSVDIEKKQKVESDYTRLFKQTAKMCKDPLTLEYRYWNAEEPEKIIVFAGRTEKFIFNLVVIILNAILSTMLYYLQSNTFSWAFIALVLCSLLPKFYGSFRYLNSENTHERKGTYDIDYFNEDSSEDIGVDEENPSQRGWKKIEVDIREQSDWVLKDKNSKILVASNTPMYDESFDEIQRTIESYINLVHDYDFIETTFLIDKIERTYETVMKLMFDEENLTKRDGVWYVLDGKTKMKRLKNHQIFYKGFWRGMTDRPFNIIWKPLGGGKRNSQLLFVRLLHLGLITKPRDGILYVDADTSFTPKSFHRLYNGLMRNPKNGAACGEIEVRNVRKTNVYTSAQAFEYLVNHMLSKSAESYYGIVLCCPGAWCMYRVEAVQSVVEKYSSTPENIRQFHRLEQGEDRYQNTLVLQKGFKAVMVKSAVATTQVPGYLKKLTEQRRRWNNSTLENTFDVLQVSRLWGLAPLYMVFFFF